jgi:cyclin H
MLAALSLADRGLTERLMQETFHYVAPASNNSGADTPMYDATTTTTAPSKRAPATRVGGEEDKATIIGSHVRDKVLGAIEACRDMLAKELPERREHWTNVSSPPRPLFPNNNPALPFTDPLTNKTPFLLPPARKPYTKPSSNRYARSSTSAATRSAPTS